MKVEYKGRMCFSSERLHGCQRETRYVPCPSGDAVVACLRSKSPSNGLEEEKGRKLQDKGQSLFSDHLIGITLPCLDMLTNASSFQHFIMLGPKT